MSVSLEAVASWLASCLEPKQPDKPVSLVEQQHVVIREREPGQAVKRTPGHYGTWRGMARNTNLCPYKPYVPASRPKTAIFVSGAF